MTKNRIRGQAAIDAVWELVDSQQGLPVIRYEADHVGEDESIELCPDTDARIERILREEPDRLYIDVQPEREEAPLKGTLDIQGRTPDMPEAWRSYEL